MRRLSMSLAALAASLCGTAACAQGKLGPPASDVMPPVELTINLQGKKPLCEPTELKLPADTNVELHVISHADVPVTITMQNQFENGHVLHADGDLVHVASEKGYLVKQNGQGTLRFRTLGAGEEPFGCTSNANRDDPFTGKLVLTAPNR